MRKKRETHNDLPPISDPNYHKMWRKKHKEYSKLKYKEWSKQQVIENPNYWVERYDAEKAADYRQKNRSTLLEKQWNRRGIVGLTYERYEEDLIKQNNCCAICGKYMNKPQADHDHITGRYRGILCIPCNNGLGIYEKNKERFESYLKGQEK